MVHTPGSTILVTDTLLLYPPNKMFLAISLIYFGMGTVLFLFIATILFLRLINHELLPSELAPTNFILLAPIGILIVDFLSIFSHADLLFGSSSSNCLNPLNLVLEIWIWTLGFNRKRNALFEIHEEGISLLPRMVELRVPNCCVHVRNNCPITACRTFQTSVFYTLCTFNVHMDRGLC